MATDLAAIDEFLTTCVDTFRAGKASTPEIIARMFMAMETPQFRDNRYAALVMMTATAIQRLVAQTFDDEQDR
jgi:hypothetical protein